MDLFSSKKTKCAGCGNKIDNKESKVEALKKHYHAACFACHKCHKPISGDFQAVDEKPWCGSCYAEEKAPRCVECGKAILHKHIKTDDGRSFHEPCFENASQGDCVACGNKIRLDETVTDALGKLFHEECFRCFQCGGELPMEFHVADGKPICDHCNKKNHRHKEDAELLQETVREVQVPEKKTETVVRNAEEEVPEKKTETVVRNAEEEVDERLALPPHHLGDSASSGECSGCNQKIRLTEPSISVPKLGRNWHVDCLKCGHCKNNISAAFHVQNELPTCDDCHGIYDSPECANCGQLIEGDKVKAMSQLWHPDCFTCAVCNEALYRGGKEYFNVEGKPFCKLDVAAANILVV